MLTIYRTHSPPCNPSSFLASPSIPAPLHPPIMCFFNMTGLEKRYVETLPNNCLTYDEAKLNNAPLEKILAKCSP